MCVSLLAPSKPCSKGHNSHADTEMTITGNMNCRQNTMSLSSIYSSSSRNPAISTRPAAVMEPHPPGLQGGSSDACD